VSPLCLGAMMFGAWGNPDHEESVRIIHRALDAGINFIDTADAYGDSEDVVGKALEGRRDEVVLATKFGVVLNEQLRPAGINGRPEYVRQACEASLRRLALETIDLYYIHRVDPKVPIEDTVGAMSDLVRAGKVRFLGISEAGAQTIRRAHRVHPMSAVQIEYSLWSREVEDEILPLCRELGIGFVGYSPLGRGFLTGGVGARDDLADNDARRNMPRFQEENLTHNLDLVSRLRQLAAQQRCTAAQLALAWVLSRGDFIVPIPGTSHRHRLEENAAAADIALSAATLSALDEIFRPGAAAGPRYAETYARTLGI
ncbi:MAG: aldo/keto reductase, partial [Stellaceae bacterium]